MLLDELSKHQTTEKLSDYGEKAIEFIDSINKIKR